jgi:hypothetical protein
MLLNIFLVVVLSIVEIKKKSWVFEEKKGEKKKTLISF